MQQEAKPARSYVHREMERHTESWRKGPNSQPTSLFIAPVLSAMLTLHPLAVIEHHRSVAKQKNRKACKMSHAIKIPFQLVYIDKVSVTINV